MPSINRFPPYIIAAAVLFMITFYHVFNVRKKNTDLERNVNVFKEELSVSKEKNKVLVKDALEKIDKKDTRIKQLEQENLLKHTKLGEKQSKLAEIKSKLELKNDEIKKLHQLAADHKAEITTLTKSVLKSKEVLTKLSEKADYLMVDHKKLKKENTEVKEQNEKLQNDIKQQQSERQTLGEKLNTLKIENQDLRIKVNDLTRKNQVIQESIKQKIKESYAARRVMTRPPRVKETTDEQPKLETPQDLMHRLPKFGHTDSEQPKIVVNNSDHNEVPTVIVGNSDKDRNNVSKIMVDNSDNSNSGNVSRIMVDNSDNNKNNISRIMVDNNSENREKRDTISDAFVAKTTTTAKSSFVGGDESLHDAASNKFLTIDSLDKTTKNPSDNIDVNTPRDEHLNHNQPGFQPEIITPERASENVEQGKNGNMNRESLSEGRGEERISEMRTGSDTLPVFPMIEDETIDRQSMHESPKVYGDHLQDNFKRNTVSVDETDS